MLAWAVVVAVVVVWNIQLRRRVRARTSELQTKHDQLLQEMRERQRVEETLRLTQFSVDHSAYAVFWIGGDARFLFVNNTACRCLGYTREELLTMTVHDIDPDLPRADWESRRRACQERGFSTFEARHRARDGRIYPVEITSSYLRFNGTDYLCSFVRDITERKRAAGQFQQLQRDRDDLFELMQLQIERMPVGYLLSGPDLRYRHWNPEAERIFGFCNDEVVGKHPFEVIVPPASQPFVQSIFDRLVTGDMSAHACCENVTRDGRTIVCDWKNTPLLKPDGSFVGLLSMAADVTEHKRLEAELLQAQKMEAIGNLAGGVAHDFNNLLTVVTGYAGLLLGTLPGEDSSRPFIDEIRKAGDRAADLTRQLLAFSRKQMLSPVVLDLNNTVASMYKMLRRLIGEDIELVMHHDPSLGRVRADQTQITQVLMNLAVNARDAMPRGGTLTVGLSNVVVDQRLTRGQEVIQPGKYVLLTMTDTGTGMDEHTKAHLFEPFFTTKEVGQGTGLGLATAYGIIRQSGGFIEVESTLARGSTFKIYLPTWEGATAVEASSAAPVDGPRGTETVLVVEDDANVRMMVCQVLSRSGYTVLESANGQAGAQMCAEHAAALDLVVTDMIMPGLSGPELRELVRREQPRLRFLFMTGYTDYARFRNGAGDNGEKNLLLKPFTPGQLARRVRELLDE
jgi:PAS domain S-box-containing protein